jgi:uncharacterized membrane protein YhaH (DUF805 family)
MSTQNPYPTWQTQFQSPFGAQPIAPPMSLGSLLFSFEGRIPRRVFWITNVLMTIVLLAVEVTIALAAVSALRHDAQNTISLVLLPWQLLSTWISLALLAKRWHDRDKSGLWALIVLVPIIGAIWTFVETGCLRGTVGPNQYGADPT